MNVAVLGSGGREHSLCHALKKSNNINKIFCIPGNAGTEQFYNNIKVDISNFDLLHKEIKKNKIKLIIVGPEQPLTDGIVNYFNSKKINIFGPDKFCSKLEGSKIFTKKLCKENNIPTANFGFFTKFKEAEKFINANKLPIVIKADGLASGKGVFVCKKKREAISAIKKILSGKFKSSSKVLIEEFLLGEEMSYFIIADGKSFKTLGTAQDHKRVGENDTGANTGGMGSYSPSNIINPRLDKKIINKIIKPTLKALKKKKHTYKGFLYVGLMIFKNEPFLIEYNIRMGDPECQTILPRLKTNLFKIINSCINNNLSKIKIKFKKKKSMCIVVCAKGYPKKYTKNIEIKNIKNLNLKDNKLIYHAGTYKKNNKIYSNGGRILNIISLSGQLKKARKDIIKLIDKLKLKKIFYRKDIGWRVIS